MSVFVEPTLCAPFVDELPVTGAAITMFDNAGRQITVCASSALAARLDELQFELGEGPTWMTFRSGEPALLPDVAAGDPVGYPLFTAALAEMPVGAMFAIPMRLGAATVGVVSLYRDRSGPLTPLQLRHAGGLAHGSTARAVALALRSAELSTEARSDPSAPLMRREVHQATGILIVHLDLSATEAFLRLRAHSFATGRSIQEVARDVVARVIDFRDLDDAEQT